MKSNPNRSCRRQPVAPSDPIRPTCRHGRSRPTPTHKVQDLVTPLAAGGARGAKHPGCRMSRRTLALADLKLRQIEDAFLDTLLDAHPRRTTALDRLLDDLAAVRPNSREAIAGAAVPAPDADAASASARRIESSLLAAVVEHHPRRDRALDRLLDDVVVAGDTTPSAAPPDAAHGAWVDEDDCRRSAPDPFCDSDFDGLG